MTANAVLAAKACGLAESNRSGAGWMNELTEAQIAELGWCDASFYGYYWDSDFADPTLVVRIAPANSPALELVCHWATSLELTLDYRGQLARRTVGGVL